MFFVNLHTKFQINLLTGDLVYKIIKYKLPFTNVNWYFRKTMWAARREKLPVIPKNQDEVFAALKSFPPTTNKEEHFLLANDFDAKMIVFSTFTNLYFLCHSECIYADGTFDYAPKFFSQMFSIHAYKNGYYIPVVFCFLPSKKEDTYITLFKLIINKCNEFGLQFSPSSIVVDFEIAIQNAIDVIWPNTIIMGCRFHLRQAWFRKIQSLGLVTEYRKGTEIGKFLKYLFALQFLSSDEVGDAFSIDLISDMPEDKRVKDFCDYLTDNYIGEDSKYPPHIWAACSASLRRTTNACESFHSRFNKSFYATHPNIFSVIDTLLEFQTEIYIKIKTANKFRKDVRSDVRRKQNAVAKIINDYNLNCISRIEFLKCISYMYAPK